MITIDINLNERSYSIYVQNSVADQAGSIAKAAGLAGPIALVSDEHVLPLHGITVRRTLEAAGFEVHVYALSPGEENKSLQSAIQLWNFLIDSGFTRNSTLIALGGGVVGDVSGFVASTFMRGIAFVQMPTSMIGQLDSSIGGKTGVNFPQAKNIIGAFYQPRMVLTDPSFLTTLPKRELLSGFGEVVKYALLIEGELFSFLEENVDRMKQVDLDCLEYLIIECARYKAKLVEQDERDLGVRTVLNLGHTIGHAIEKCAGYGKYRHGEAVAAGLVYALKLAKQLELLEDESLLDRTVELLRRLELPTAVEIDTQEILKTIQRDKKVTTKNKSRFILPKAIGQMETVQVPSKDIQIVLE